MALFVFEHSLSGDALATVDLPDRAAADAWWKESDTRPEWERNFTIVHAITGSDFTTIPAAPTWHEVATSLPAGCWTLILDNATHPAFVYSELLPNVAIAGWKGLGGTVTRAEYVEKPK